jgi:hypothetical protein
MLKVSYKNFFFALVIFFLFFPVAVFTQNKKKDKKQTKPEMNSVKKELEKVKGVNFASNNTSPTEATAKLIGRAIKLILQVIGTAALAMFIYGGLLIMTSRGQSDKYNQGMKTMLWSAIGVITALSSYALVSFVFQGVSSQNSPSRGNKTCQSRPNASCIDIKNCKGVSTSNNPSIGKMRKQCSNSNFCQTGVCPNQPKNIVCCSQTK